MNALLRLIGWGNRIRHGAKVAPPKDQRRIDGSRKLAPMIGDTEKRWELLDLLAKRETEIRNGGGK